MASVAEFEPALKDVVQGKLSQSRMKKLTEIALKSMENDTQLVSTLYRTHKSLPAKAKVSSLYAFDALARAARNKANKHGAGESDSGKGNCATFLLKVEGVLDSLFQDMLSSKTPEAKRLVEADVLTFILHVRNRQEKTKKVLDIWVKSNTFPSAVLARLADIVKEADKEPEINPETTPGPRPESTPPVQIPVTQPTAPPGVHAVQSTLLALLNQAANAAGGNLQIPPNREGNSTVAQVAQLDVNQLALIQQLAQTSQLGSANAAQSTSLPLASAPPGIAQAPNAYPSHPFRPPDRDDRREYDRRGPRGDSFNGPARSRSPYDHRDDRRDFRGGYRGGYRGRGRGRMDDRDRFRDSRDHDWRSPPQGPRSRSRSPPGSRYGRDRQPHSPPRKPPPRQPTAYGTTEPLRPSGPAGDRDEFGRDIRPQSSRDAGTASASHEDIDMQSRAALTSVASSLEPSSPTLGDNKVSLSQPPSYPKGADAGSSKVGVKEKGLDDYAFSTFDPTLPAAWEALGNAWQVTHGYIPSAEEIMQLVMAKTMPGMGPESQLGAIQQEKWSSGDWQQSGDSGAGESWSTSTAAQWSSGNGSNGGHSYGNARGEAERSYGGQTVEQYEAIEAGEVAEGPDADSGGDGGAGGRGRMQKVGDKWIFVKGQGST